MKTRVAIAVSAIIEKIELVFGGFWVFVTCFGLLTDPADDFAVNVILLLFGLGALAAFLDGLKRKKLRKDFKKIVAYLSAEPTGRLSGIGTALGMDVARVKLSIARMISKGFFANAYINEMENRLVVNGNNAVNYQEMPEAELVPRQCRNCGGISKIVVGKPCQCDYCGTILQ